MRFFEMLHDLATSKVLLSVSDSRGDHQEPSFELFPLLRQPLGQRLAIGEVHDGRGRKGLQAGYVTMASLGRNDNRFDREYTD